jgi:hypothetical protein
MSDEPELPWWRHLAGTVLLMTGWAAMASWHPTTTWHLAPFMIGASASVAARLRTAAPVATPRATRLTAIPAIAGLAETVLLNLAGRLAGPTVIDRGSALVESLLFVTLGGWWGYRTAVRARPRWWVRILRGATS